MVESWDLTIDCHDTALLETVSLRKVEANVSLLASVGQKREPKLRLAKH